MVSFNWGNKTPTTMSPGGLYFDKTNDAKLYVCTDQNVLSFTGAIDLSYDPEFNNNSWATIKQCVQNGIAKSIWPVGSMKSLNINAEYDGAVIDETVQMVVMHYKEDGSMVLGTCDCLKSTFVYSASDDPTYYGDSDLHALLTDIYRHASTLSDVRRVLDDSPASLKCYNLSTNRIETVAAYFFAPSEEEVSVLVQRWESELRQ